MLSLRKERTSPNILCTENLLHDKVDSSAEGSGTELQSHETFLLKNARYFQKQDESSPLYHQVFCEANNLKAELPQNKDINFVFGPERIF